MPDPFIDAPSLEGICCTADGLCRRDRLCSLRSEIERRHGLAGVKDSKSSVLRHCLVRRGQVHDARALAELRLPGRSCSENGSSLQQSENEGLQFAAYLLAFPKPRSVAYTSLRACVCVCVRS